MYLTIVFGVGKTLPDGFLHRLVAAAENGKAEKQRLSEGLGRFRRLFRPAVIQMKQICQTHFVITSPCVFLCFCVFLCLRYFITVRLQMQDAISHFSR